MFSQLSSIFKRIFEKFSDSKIDCQKINLDSHGKQDRVSFINSAAQNCCCESFKMSSFSPSPIRSDESIARFVFSPMHVDKKGNAKTSIFSHIVSKGCSIQREDNAKDDEINRFIDNFISVNEESWHAVLLINCSELRKISIDGKPVLCIYDTAKEENPSHGEICVNREYSAADILELRRNMLKAFRQISTNDYREGEIFATYLKGKT